MRLNLVPKTRPTVRPLNRHAFTTPQDVGLEAG